MRTGSNFKSGSKSYEITRKKIDNSELVSISGKTSESWLIVNGKKASVAFKYENGKIVPCDTSEALYHCYLPTFDKVVFPIKVNSDFSTDPSRKHLTSDEITDNSISAVAELLFDIVKNIFAREHNPIFSNILAILSKTQSFSRANSLLKERFKEMIVTKKWIILNNGMQISAKDYKTLPEWLEDSEKAIIRQSSMYVNELSLKQDIYKKIAQAEEFLGQFSSCKFGIDELIIMMEDTEFVSSINQQTHGKILGNIIKSGKSAQYISGQSYSYDRIAIFTDKGVR